MVMIKTKLIISDNSGGLFGKCIQTYFNKVYANLGEIIKLSIKKVNPKKKIKKKKIYSAIVISHKKIKKRLNGISIKFSKNRVLLISDQLKFLGTRYKGPIAKEVLVWKKRILKIVKLAKKIL